MQQHNEHIETSRNRDFLSYSTKTKALYTFYEWLTKKDHIAVTSRVSNSISHREVTAKYSTVTADYQKLIHLGSYNYAGLNDHPSVINAAQEALQKYGVTTSGVRLLNGTTDLHLAFEQRLAKFLGFEDVVTYSSGFSANISVLSALCSEKDIVFSDSLNHQSIVDGLKLSGTNIIKFPHKDYVALEAAMKGQTYLQRKFIITDGIFSMDGDVADLHEIVRIANEYNAFIIVDDAHATAAFGPNGRGTPSHFNLTHEIDVLTGSLSKGLPGVGGFAACSSKTANILRYGSNGYIFSASIPAPTIAGLLAAIDILESQPEIQEKLHNNEKLLRDGILNMGLNVMHSETAVIPIPIPNRDLAFTFARKLHECGVYVNAICFPAVSRHQPRLRLNASAALTEKDISTALTALEKTAKALKLIGA